jgi:hypothetical protein
VCGRAATTVVAFLFSNGPLLRLLDVYCGHHEGNVGVRWIAMLRCFIQGPSRFDQRCQPPEAIRDRACLAQWFAPILQEAAWNSAASIACAEALIGGLRPAAIKLFFCMDDHVLTMG